MKYSKSTKEWMKHTSRLIIIIYLFSNEGKTITDMRNTLEISIRQQWKSLTYLKNKNLVKSIRIKGKGNKLKKGNFKISKYKLVYLTKKGKFIAEKLIELDLLLSN